MQNIGFLMTRLIYFCLFVFIVNFSAIFADCRTGLCKNNVQYVNMYILAAVYFCDLVFCRSKLLAKLNWFTVVSLSRYFILAVNSKRTVQTWQMHKGFLKIRFKCWLIDSMETIV